jgi:hypothetical protein
MSKADGGASGRDHFIPVRKIDVQNALIERNALGGEPEREKFKQLCRLLGAIYHYRYFDQVERLRDDYYYFNPEIDGHSRFDKAAVARAYRDLIDALSQVLRRANFTEIPHHDIEHAHRTHAFVRVNIETSSENYREARFFRRGHHMETVDINEWFGLRKRHAEIAVYDDVVLLVTTKLVSTAPVNGLRRARKPKVRPGAVLLKHFRDIAGADLNALFPDVRVVMGTRDRLMLALSTLIGGVPILLKLASTLTVLFLVAGFYLGVSGSVRDSDIAGALAAVSGLIAFGGFAVGQWVRFQRQSLLHHKVLTDNIYYRNVNNNAGAFGYLIGEAEEQECKEAFLAYYFLLVSGDGMTADALDRCVEAWLREAFDVDIDFDCNDALAKLDGLELLRRAGSRVSVPPLDDALRQLDRIWGNFFPLNAIR